VLEKDRGNFCDYFSPNGAGAVELIGKGAACTDVLSELEKLFRKP